VGEVFGIVKSFLVLFMIIIGGLGSIFGSFAGAAFLVLLPVMLKLALADSVEVSTASDVASWIFFYITAAAAVLFVVSLIQKLMGKGNGLMALWGGVAIVGFLLAALLGGGLGWPTDIVAHVQLMIIGLLIVIFLIAEPHGLAQLWRVAKEKLRLWPFPH
jgi:branched-chain amino acid transport system permease protein